MEGLSLTQANYKDLALEKSNSKELSHSQVRGKGDMRGAEKKHIQKQQTSRRYREATPNNRQSRDFQAFEPSVSNVDSRDKSPLKIRTKTFFQNLLHVGGTKNENRDDVSSKSRSNISQNRSAADA